MLGEKIKKIRLEKGLGVNESAKLAGISGSYWSNIEKGKKINPSTDTLKKMAAVLGVSIDTFFSNEENELISAPDITPTERIVNTLIDALIAEDFIKSEDDIDKGSLDLLINAIKLQADKKNPK